MPREAKQGKCMETLVEERASGVRYVMSMPVICSTSGGADSGDFKDRSFHEKADPCQEFFCSLHDFFSLFPFGQAASVATLPSALVVERFSLGASWVFSIPVGAATWEASSTSFLRGKLGKDLVAVT